MVNPPEESHCMFASFPEMMNIQQLTSVHVGVGSCFVQFLMVHVFFLQNFLQLDSESIGDA